MSFLSAPRVRRTAAVIAALAATAACSAGAPDQAQTVGSQSTTSPASSGQQRAASRAFTFAAAGDLGANPATARSLAALDASSAGFFLALGDLDYDQTPSDRAWCDYVKDRLPTKGGAFPFEVLVGNHEQDGGPDGRISNFADCLPDRLGSEAGPGGVYGAEYSFGYPAGNPLAKFIMISPKLSVDGERYTYGVGSPHRRWLVNQIDEARADGVRWVIVGSHHPCLNTGIRHGCDSGQIIMNLLLKKRVDLFLAGHNHLYERSKQLRRNDSGCRRVVPNTFDADCVVDAGRDGAYRKGRGAVLLTSGSFGRLEPAEDTNDAEARYFAKSSATSSGFTQVNVTRRRITGHFVRTSGTLHDSFEIIAR